MADVPSPNTPKNERRSSWGMSSSISLEDAAAASLRVLDGVSSASSKVREGEDPPKYFNQGPSAPPIEFRSTPLKAMNSWVKTNASKENVLLIVALVVMVLTRSIDYILYVRLAYKMEPYEWFLSQILLSFSFCVLSWPIVWYRMWRGTITEEMRTFPLKIFALIGLADAMGNLISTIPAPYVSGPVNVVTAQAVIPFTMLFSLIILHVRYHILHYAGAIVIGAGIFINVFPEFLKKGALSGSLIWIVLLIGSTVPMALSNVIKEKGLKSNKEKDMDVWYFNAWVALFQLLFGAAACWTVFIPMPAPAESIPPSSFPSYIEDASLCFLGIDSDARPQAHCSYTWMVFAVYIAFNITFNVTMLYVFQQGSAALAVLASALRLALSSLGFHIPFLAGEATEKKFHVVDVIALIILIVGLVVYKIRPEKQADSPVNTTEDLVEEGLMGAEKDDEDMELDELVLESSIDSDD